MPRSATVWVFWGAFAFLAYTLVGYPLLLRVLSTLCPRPRKRAEIFPSVTIIIAVHNARTLIAEKIENTLQLDYPASRLEIVVGSDASDDGTNEIVESYRLRGVRLAAVAERRGKQAAQLAALQQSTGELVVFTDAAVILEGDALRQIVSNFADPGVGCVSSEDRIRNDASPNAEAFYVSAEMKLRRMESEISSVVGVSGSFFAARRCICQDWHWDQTSDFFVPLHAVALGFRTVGDPNSIAYFRAVSSAKSEFPRKVRTVVNGLVVLFDHLHLLDPSRFGVFAWQLLSHKLFRWLLPFGFVALIISNVLLAGRGWFFGTLIVLQAAGYLLALLGLGIKAFGRWGPVRLTVYLVVSNFAVLVAWFKFACGERYVVWNPTKR